MTGVFTTRQAGSRKPGRNLPLIAGFWLILLINPMIEYADHLGDPQVVLAYVVLVPFAATYLALLFAMRNLPLEARGTLPPRVAWGGIALLYLMCLVMYPAFGQDALNLTAFPILAAGLILPTRQSLALVLGYALVAWGLTLWWPGFENDINVPIILIGAGFVMASLRQNIVSNIDLLAMRQENETLLVEQERNRFARDLHDILGHSLTVITVKAELAGRLFEADPARALQEVHDLERLSREAMSDVRSAVQGYREITLGGEIARARVALEAAGIEAELPTSADDAEGSLRTLFAWAIREGVTNVVRHAGARRCIVELEADRVVVRNDGDHAGPVVEGNGLRGLRERAAAVGAQVKVWHTAQEGFVLEVVGGR